MAGRRGVGRRAGGRFRGAGSRGEVTPRSCVRVLYYVKYLPTLFAEADVESIGVPLLALTVLGAYLFNPAIGLVAVGLAALAVGYSLEDAK